MNRWDSVNVEGSDMPIYVALPDGGHSHPAIVLTFHRTGLDRFTTESADRLAEAGFLTVAPDFYHRHKAMDAEEAVKLRNDEEVIADISATVRHLNVLDNVKTDNLTIMGHCMGGRTALLGACVLPNSFKLCLPFYTVGMNYVRQQKTQASAGPWVHRSKNCTLPSSRSLAPMELT